MSRIIRVKLEKERGCLCLGVVDLQFAAFDAVVESVDDHKSEGKAIVYIRERVARLPSVETALSHRTRPETI
jgi:hypothetical protein